VYIFRSEQVIKLQFWLKNHLSIRLSSVYVPANTVQVIWETVFTGQKTQPTVSKYWRNI